MTGLPNLNGNNFYPNMYNNPYASSMNNDFMASQYFNQPAFGTSPYGNLEQPKVDSFEHSTGSSPLVTGLKVGGTAAAITGAGTYFLGSDPVNKGVVDEAFLKQTNQKAVKDLKLQAIAELFEGKAQPTLTQNGIKDFNQYDAIEKLSKASKLDDLSKEVKDALPSNIQTPEDAKALIEKVKPELDKIDTKKIAKTASNYVDNNFSIAGMENRITKLKNISAKIEQLPNDAKVADLEKFFIENAETFGLKGTETEIAAKAKKIATTHGTKESLLNLYKKRITTRTTKLTELKETMSTSIKSNFDDAGKLLTEGVDDAFKKSVSEFKWAKTGKFAAIAAGVGLAIGWLFSSDKK